MKRAHSKEIKTAGHPMEKVVLIVRSPESVTLSTTLRSSARLLRVSGCCARLRVLRLWYAFREAVGRSPAAHCLCRHEGGEPESEAVERWARVSCIGWCLGVCLL
jgi:hypothetical protein